MIEGYNTGHDRFTYKGYGRIYVRTPEDIQVVEDLLRELDQNEFDYYYPGDLVTTFDKYPWCVYTGKYEQNLKELKQVCAERNIPIFCLDAGKEPDTPGYQVTLNQEHIQLLLERSYWDNLEGFENE